MKKEILHILIYVKENRILVKIIKDIKKYIPTEDEYFILKREEILLTEENKNKINEYFDIKKLSPQENKLFYSPILVILSENFPSYLKLEMLDLLSYLKKDINIMTLEELKVLSTNE